jgi:mannose-6-phosphate isomerase-like protein (cupin superfamily)
MGYHVIDPETVEPTPDRPRVQRSDGDEAGLENVALNVYEVAPGERIPLAYHYHDDSEAQSASKTRAATPRAQEKVFNVLSGELHVETSEGERVVPEDDPFVVEPDSPQRAFNPEDADGPVETLVLGAPSTDDVHAYDPDQ